MPAIPKPEADLARPRERKGSNQQAVSKGVRRPTTIPAADPEWHMIAKELYESVSRSGQADFYQDSDWWMLYNLMDDLSLYKKAGKRSAMMFSSIMSAMNSLLLTEGDRRRVRIELHEPPPTENQAQLVAIAGYREKMGL